MNQNQHQESTSRPASGGHVTLSPEARRALDEEKAPGFYGAVVGLALSATYLAVSAIVYVGNLLVGGVIRLVPPGGGGGGGSPPSPPSQASFEFLGIGSLLWAILIIVMFLAMIVYSLKVLLRLPLRADWSYHVRFARLLRPSPAVVLVVLWVTNYLPTHWIETVYRPRLYVSYLCSLAAMMYQAGFLLGCPVKIRKDDPSLSDEGRRSLTASRPVVRYLLTVLAVAIAATLFWLSAMLVPNSFAHRPENWWHAFVPP
jgi:hypothetical protein